MDEEYKTKFKEFVRGLTAEQLDELVEIIYPRHKHETMAKLMLAQRQPKYVIVEL